MRIWHGANDRFWVKNWWWRVVSGIPIRGVSPEGWSMVPDNGGVVCLQTWSTMMTLTSMDWSVNGQFGTSVIISNLTAWWWSISLDSRPAIIFIWSLFIFVFQQSMFKSKVLMQLKVIGFKHNLLEEIYFPTKYI